MVVVVVVVVVSRWMDGLDWIGLQARLVLDVDPGETETLTRLPLTLLLLLLLLPLLLLLLALARPCTPASRRTRRNCFRGGLTYVRPGLQSSTLFPRLAKLHLLALTSYTRCLQQ